MDQDEFDNNAEIVYLPDDDIYGTIIKRGAFSSTVEYYDMGVKYTVEMPNDEFVEVDDEGIEYLDETGDDF
jgi:hypothetical protein